VKRFFGLEARRELSRGQSMVEFALILPVIMFLLLGMVELGFAVNHNTSIVTATRQGARVGSELVNGSRKCNDNSVAGLAAAANVDPQIIAATEGVLRSPGSPINISQVSTITIFEVDENGNATANKNDWTLAITGGGAPNGDPIPNSSPTQKLYFKASPVVWNAKDRCGASPAHGIGVRITYTYKFITPLGSILSLVGSLFSSGQITMTDQTIMALEPPSP
jgi:hypothetical protein